MPPLTGLEICWGAISTKMSRLRRWESRNQGSVDWQRPDTGLWQSPFSHPTWNGLRCWRTAAGRNPLRSRKPADSFLHLVGLTFCIARPLRRNLYSPVPKKSATPSVKPPTVSLVDGLRRLQRVVGDGEKLLNARPIDETDFDAWTSSAIDWLEKTFGSDSSYSLPWEQGTIYFGQINQRDAEERRFRNLSKQVRYLKNLLTSHAEELAAPSPQSVPQAPVASSEPDVLDVFVSHSSTDEKLAEALIRLLRNAVGVTQSRIRCTSVNGYKLEGGIEFEDQLKIEVLKSTVFIA